MTKQEFLNELEGLLEGLPKADIEERITFYSEMIDDRIEDGILEEDAVSECGSVSRIAAQIIADIPLSRLVKENLRPRKKLSAWEIILLVCGSPLWLSLIIAAFSVGVSIYLSLWSVIISLWAAFASVAGSGFGITLAGVGFAVSGKTLTGVALIGAGVFCAGLSIAFFFLCKTATKGILLLTKKIAIGIKNIFIKKERV